MEIVLIAALVVVAATALLVALTFNRRTRQTTAPLIDAAVSDLRDQLRTTADELRRQLRSISEELRRDRDEQRLDGRKIQGRLDHADSRLSSMTSQFLAELDKIKRRGEQIGAQQDQLTGNLQRLAARAGVELEPDRAAVPGRLYVERLEFSVIRAPAPGRPGGGVAIAVERRVAELAPEPLADLGDALTVIARADHDPAFRDRLGWAASDYAADRWADPAFAAVTGRWITQDPVSEAAAAGVCQRLGTGLRVLLAEPFGLIGTELRLPATASGTGADLVLQPVAQPQDEGNRLCEITGVAAGAVTGLHPLALAAAKMLAHEEFHQGLARGISKAARTVFAGPPPQVPSGRIGPADWTVASDWPVPVPPPDRAATALPPARASSAGADGTAPAGPDRGASAGSDRTASSAPPGRPAPGGPGRTAPAAPPERTVPARVLEGPAKDQDPDRSRAPAQPSPARDPLPGQRQPDEPHGPPVRGTGQP